MSALLDRELTPEQHSACAAGDIADARSDAKRAQTARAAEHYGATDQIIPGLIRKCGSDALAVIAYALASRIATEGNLLAPDDLEDAAAMAENLASFLTDPNGWREDQKNAAIFRKALAMGSARVA